MAILREHAPELQAAGVASLSLFGSVARGDTGPGSDVDIAVRLSPHFSRGGFDYIQQLNLLRRKLSALLDCRVDLIEEPVRKQAFQSEIDRDRAVDF